MAEDTYKVEMVDSGQTVEFKTYSATEDADGNSINALTNTQRLPLEMLEKQLITAEGNVTKIKTILGLTTEATKVYAQKQADEAVKKAKEVADALKDAG